MIKWSSNLFIGGLIILLAAFPVAMLHYRDVATWLLYASVIVLLGSFTIRLFRPVPSVYVQEHGDIYKVFWVLGPLAVIFLLLGTLVKHSSYHRWGRDLTLLGDLLALVALCMLLYINNKVKRADRQQTADGHWLGAEVLDRYIGIYHSGQLNLDMTIYREDTALMGRLEGQSSFPLHMINEHIFNNTRWKLVMEFYPDKEELVLIQHGRYMPFIREHSSNT